MSALTVLVLGAVPLSGDARCFIRCCQPLPRACPSRLAVTICSFLLAPLASACNLGPRSLLFMVEPDGSVQAGAQSSTEQPCAAEGVMYSRLVKKGQVKGSGWGSDE
jgi:hypothetical protein